MSDYKVTVLGAGLAGCEAALWLAGKGVQVDLYEQKPMHFSPAHKSEGFAELICSNSLKAERLDSASGLLKEEMRRMGSQLLQAAEVARVAAGGALAVDRDTFSAEVTRRVEECPNITVHRQPVEHIDESAPILVATGPLTDGKLADEIGALTGDERLHFYDAVAPIVTAESLDYEKVFAASRYGRGDADYLNCPFNKAEYEVFHAALASAERAPLHDFDTGAEQSARPDPDAHGKKADTVTVYEGCMPIEIMAARGADTALELSRLVGDDIAVEVRQNKHLELCAALFVNQLCGHDVNVPVVKLDTRIVLCNLLAYIKELTVRCLYNIRLCYCGNAGLAHLLCVFKCCSCDSFRAFGCCNYKVNRKVVIYMNTL